MTGVFGISNNVPPYLLVTPQVLAQGLHTGKEEEGLRGCKMRPRSANEEIVIRAKDIWLLLAGVFSVIKCIHAFMANDKHKKLSFCDRLPEAKSRI